MSYCVDRRFIKMTSYYWRQVEVVLPSRWNYPTFQAYICPLCTTLVGSRLTKYVSIEREGGRGLQRKLHSSILVAVAASSLENVIFIRYVRWSLNKSFLSTWSFETRLYFVQYKIYHMESGQHSTNTSYTHILSIATQKI